MNQINNPIVNLLVIDQKVNDWQRLASNISSDTAVLILDPFSDGLTQISDYLTSMAAKAGAPDFVPLQSIQILSHGDVGSLLLGSQTLTSSNLTQYSHQLAVIGNALSETGDILLYGCNVAQGVAGEAFIAALAKATGAEVAASNNLTGAITQGGDWLLEANTGVIESKSVLDVSNTTRYANVLKTLPSTSDLLNAFGSYNSLTDTFTISSRHLFPGMSALMQAPFEAIFGPNDLVVQGVTVVTSDTDTRLSFKLPNQQSLTFIVDNDIIDKMAFGQDYLLALDYLMTNVPSLGDIIQFSLFNNLGLSALEFVLSTDDVTVTSGDASRGLNLIATIDLTKSSSPVFSFIHKHIGLNSLGVFINVNEEGMSLTGIIDLNTKIIGVDGFSIRVKQLALSIATTPDLELTTTESYQIAFKGYDPTQSNEPELFASSGLVFEVESMSMFTNISTKDLTSWKDPFGFKGGEMRQLALEVGVTYLGTGFDHVGFIADLKFMTYNFRMACAFDINDPDHIAFELTVYNEISATTLIDSLKSALLTPAALKLLGPMGDLLKFSPVTFMSFDSNGDGVLDPLLSFVPFATSIADTKLSEGMGINAQVKIFGAVGTLAFYVNPDFTDMSGSLRIKNLQLSNILSIGGIEPDSDLTASFHISAISSDQYFNGDGKITVCGFTLAQAKFSITPTHATITDALLGLGPLAFHINYLDVDLARLDASGKTSITLFNKVLTDTSFNLSSNHFDATFMLFGASATVALDINYNTHAVSGSISVDHLAINGFLTLSGIEPGSALKPTFDNANNSISGSARIALFDYTLASAQFDFSETAVSITNATLALVPGVISLKINSLGINLVNGTSSGNAEMSLFGQTIANTAFNISNHHVDFNAAFDLGAVHISDAFVWDNATHVLAGTGTIQINGTTLASASFSYTDGGVVNIRGSLDLHIKDIGSVRASVLAIYDHGDVKVTVEAGLGGLGDVHLTVKADSFSAANIAEDIYNHAVADLGAVPEYLASAIAGGVTDLFHSGAVSLVKDQVTGFVGDALGKVGSAISSLIGKSHETNQTYIGDVNDNVWNGNGGNDLFFGNGGNDSSCGHQGNDVMDGGAGNDTLTGGSNEDVINGGDGNDLLYGQEGLDLIYGGQGNDTIYGDDGVAAGHNDTIYGGEGNDELYGDWGNDTIYGDGGNDFLNGGLGADLMIGGAGNDIYVVNDIYDAVSEASTLATEIDYVYSAINYILGTNVEYLWLQAGEIGQGNTLNNYLTGNALANKLYGNAGNDTLDGGIGADELTGGLGNDLYIVDNISDKVIEASTSVTEIDTVNSQVSYTLSANVENLNLTQTQTLTGTGWGQKWVWVDNALNGTGNELNNYLTGNAAVNTLTGGAGNDTLDGGAGADNLIGGTGNDVYAVDNIGDVVTETSTLVTEIDQVNSSFSYTLGANLENLSLMGSAAINGLGNALANTLGGNAAANSLDGGTGADTLIGDLGNDTYTVDNIGDVVIETSTLSTEIDRVNSSVSYTLSANVEQLTLTGSATINGLGNALANTLTGNAGANSLDGGTGADTLIGGLGNDSYTVDNIGDVVTETSSLSTEIDSVNSNITYTLGANLENLTLTGFGAINGIGNTLTNTLTGNAAANNLDGGAGADTLIGGRGNDTYSVDNIGDVITETSMLDTEIDTVNSSVSYTLSANVEKLSLTGAATINGTGNALDNTLLGNSAANTLSGAAGDDSLDGGAGADTLVGGLGNDIYIVDNTGDVITEASTLATEIDSVNSSVSYTLSANVEKLSLTGAAAINGTGNELANILTGNSAANTLNGAAGDDSLDGGAGADTLIGGLGNDTYAVDNSLDVVTETSTLVTEIDSVTSSVTYTLSANVENLSLTGSAAINGTGSELANTLLGNSAANTLNGAGGDDSLDGGAGADTLIGGLGNDSYSVDNTGDVVTETSSLSTEIDSVNSSITYTLLANVENLTLTGSDAINGTGNALANSLTGNAEANSLNGGAGADTLIGGLGRDIYTVDNIGDVVTETSTLSTEIDCVNSSVTYTLSANVENLILIGAAAINGKGNMLANTLTGNSAANTLNGELGDDTLDGGAGADTLIGGLGNDDYTIDNTGDVVTETSSLATEIDSVNSSVSYTLSDYVENLSLTGAAAINGTGNALDNILTGNSAANTLNGAEGDDLLDGGTGADTLIGGLGNDSYTVDNTGDVVTETSTLLTEIDNVYSSANYTLSANVEKLSLTGAAAINGTGNELANILLGNSAVNTLNGAAGDDLLDGGAGADTLIGGLGNDSYLVDNIGDVITETSSPDSGIDSVNSSVSYTLSDYVENLTLIGAAALNGTGNALNNILTGNAADNSLDGGAGADTLIGGLGGDSYIVDNIGDVVTETSSLSTEIDSVNSSVSYTLSDYVENLTLTGSAAINGTGNALANSLTGNAGANSLDGGAGADTLIGGLGNDSYTVDNTGDVVTETSSLSTEIDSVNSSVSYTLSDYVENMTLTGSAAINGTGNALANSLTGNAAANSLDGGVGADTLIGGLGNDSYTVDNIGDVVTETSSLSTEIDSVNSSVSYSLTANVENLNLTQTLTDIDPGRNEKWVWDNIALNGTGNALNNILTGNAAANSLDGGAGADTLIGGLGNDSYTVDNIGDVVTETSARAKEIDSVNSSITYTLSANVENLTLTGSAALNGTGNELDNILTGNAGANRLDGGAGADTLIGGLGNDSYTVDNSGDVVTETSTLSTEIDSVNSSIAYTLGDNIENLTLTGSEAINGTGNALANSLTGNAEANSLNGGAGADTLIGGLGRDIYTVDNIGDVVTETSTLSTEIDSVNSSITYTLSANVEKLILTGSAALNGTGNSLANSLTGNDAANSLDGGAGADTLIGGLGNDDYTIDNTGDVVTETSSLATEIDSVNSSVSFSLDDNIENLTLTGSTAINGTGNKLANILTGNAAANSLDGGAGADTLIGGLGNDSYTVDNKRDVVTETSSLATEIDSVNSSVTYTLSDYLENMTLTGSAAINGTGNALANSLTGNAADNSLDGGVGADTLIGGLGNDSYIVDNTGDVVTETSTLVKEIDSVYSSVSYTLSDYVENLSLTGLEAINGTGNMLNNTLTGNSAANTLNGGAGNDSLDGGTGMDTLIGGLGNDSYTVDNTGDVVTETSALTTEIDSVNSFISYTLGANVENLILKGTAINGTGNELANTLIGNGLNNTLNGGAGNDLLIGGPGQDILTGGAGNDIFAFIDPVDFMNGLKLPARNPVRDFITDFVSGQDKIDLSALDADEKGDNGDQAFALISTAFNAPGQIRYSAGIISINTDKDSAAEYEIVLTGLIPITLSATDFILQFYRAQPKFFISHLVL